MAVKLATDSPRAKGHLVSPAFTSVKVIKATPMNRNAKAEVKNQIQHEEIEHNGAFFIEQDGKRVAELTYSRANDSLVIIDHTEVDRSLEGQGVARSLVDDAVRWARETGTKVAATCPYASAQFAKDPSIRDVMA